MSLARVRLRGEITAIRDAGNVEDPVDIASTGGGG